MDTRTSFRLALAATRGYRPDHMARRPAFIYSLARRAAVERRSALDLPVLPPVTVPGSAAAAARALAAGETTAVELTQRALAAIHVHDRALNAFAYLAREDELLRQAEALDRERAAGRVRGPLHGIPVSVKDVIHVAGMPTTSSSKVMQGFMPSADAAAVAKLRQAGAVIMGKVHTHEFALGVTTPQSRNPWDPTRDPGGSSGGSAISVATGMSLLSLGTDTRASIRVPASLCGIVGYKPTYGLVSTEGVITLSWSIDHVGLQGSTCEDVALMMNAVQGHDPKDPNTLDVPPQDNTAYVYRNASGLRVGLAVNGLRDAQPDVRAVFDTAVAKLKAGGVDIVSVDMPSEQDFHLAMTLGLILSRCEAAEFHSAFPDAWEQYTPVVADQLDEALAVKAVDYLRAQRFRGEFAERMIAVFSGLDALLLPTTLAAAPKAEESGDYFMLLSQNCIPWSMIGFPALSVPCGYTNEGLPVGAQLVAAPFADDIVLALGSALERFTEHREPPVAKR